MRCMAEEDSAVEKYFTQVKIDTLPEGTEPKFRIGDLVRIVFRSDYGPAAYELKDNVALVCEVLYYQCTNYDWQQMEDRIPFYLIEYKLLPTNKVNDYRYVSEQNLRKLEND